MIEKELFFEYNLNYQYLFDITANNNYDFVSIIDDLKEYRQGLWKNNKRKDIIQFILNDIPTEFLSITSMIIKNNIIPIKIKLKIIENNSQQITIKVCCNLLNKLMNIITKIINIKLFITIININNIKSKVIVKYVIKSILPHDIIDKINNYIESKINNNYIIKSDTYLKNLAIKINNNNGKSFENC